MAEPTLPPDMLTDLQAEYDRLKGVRVALNAERVTNAAEREALRVRDDELDVQVQKVNVTMNNIVKLAASVGGTIVV